MSTSCIPFKLVSLKRAALITVFAAFAVSAAGCAGTNSTTAKDNASSASSNKPDGKRFVDSGEYKDKDFKRGCMADYSDLTKLKDTGWGWIAPGYKLSQYNLKVGSIENRSSVRLRSLTDSVRTIFSDNFAGYSRKGVQTLTANLCIYDAQNFSPGKAYIPFAGGHKMQAGIGIEMTLMAAGKPVAKFRHFAREGARIEDATQEVAEDLLKYIGKN